MALIALAKVLNDGRVDLITLHHSWIIALPRGHALFFAIIADGMSRIVPFYSPLLGLFPP